MTDLSSKTESLRGLDSRFGDFWKRYHDKHSWCTPTVLTLSRVVMFIPFLFFMTVDYLTPLALLPLMWIALFDIFDGVLARAANLRTRFGGFIDQATDKLLIITILWFFFSLLGDNPFNFSNTHHAWHQHLLWVMIAVICVCDGINLLIRLVEAFTASITNFGNLRQYWLEPYKEISNGQKDQVSSNAGKIKVWLLTIGSSFMCVSWGLLISQGSSIQMFILGVVTTCCVAYGLWMIPKNIRLDTATGEVILIASSIVFLSFFKGQPSWFWYMGDVLIFGGMGCALWSTLFQIRRRIKSFVS